MSRIAPCEERRKRHLEYLADVREKSGEQIYWRTLGKLAANDYWLFCREVLLYDWMDPWLHGEDVAGFLDQTENDTRLILLPRGAGKTGFVTVPRPVWWLVRDIFANTLLANAREDRARKMTKAIAAIIKGGGRFQSCYPEIVPSKKWGEAGYFIDVSVEQSGGGATGRVDPTFGAYGIAGNVTGAHPRNFILDDAINREMISSPPQMRQAERFFVESNQNCIETDGNYLVIGTRWTYGDFYGKLESGELVGRKGRVRVLKLGVTKSTRAGDEVLIWPRTKYFDRATKREKVVGYTWEELEQKRAALKGLFNALYYNEPVMDADRKFETAMIKTYKSLPFETGPVAMVGIETESQSGALATLVAQLARAEGRRMRVEALKSKRVAKEERILTALQSLVAEGRMNLPEYIWRSESNLGEEFRTFDKGTDDCLDACAYCAMVARENKGDGPPSVYITVDPAFSTESYSDYTAIVAGCFFQNEFWVLDVQRFQTDRTDQIARMIFRVYDKYRSGYRAQAVKSGGSFRGFGVTKSRGPAQSPSNWTEGGFDVDLSGLLVGDK